MYDARLVAMAADATAWRLHEAGQDVDLLVDFYSCLAALHHESDQALVNELARVMGRGDPRALKPGHVRRLLPAALGLPPGNCPALLRHVSGAVLAHLGGYGPAELVEVLRQLAWAGSCSRALGQAVAARIEEENAQYTVRLAMGQGMDKISC